MEGFEHAEKVLQRLYWFAIIREDYQGAEWSMVEAVATYPVIMNNNNTLKGSVHT